MDKEPTIIAQLYSHPEYNFSLVGSRYLGIEDEDSDWDFVVTWAPGVSRALEAMGFRAMELTEENPAYTGSYVVAVMQGFFDGVKVQVSMEKNAMWKKLIMRAMEKSPELARFDRELRKDPCVRDNLWAALYELAGYTENEETLAGYDHEQIDRRKSLRETEPGDDDIPF